MGGATDILLLSYTGAVSTGGDLTINGAATATTPAADDNDTSVATTAWVQTELLDGAPIATVSASTLTLDATYKGKWIRLTNSGGGCAITINTSVFATGDEVYFENATAGAVSFTGTATLNRGTYTLATQYDVGGVKFSSASVGTIFGAITAP